MTDIKKEVDGLEAISDFVFVSKYARYNEKEKRRETWEEAVGRTEAMHLKRFKHLDKESLAKIKWAFDLVRDKRVVPSMRGLQFSGKAVEAHQARLYNCSVLHVSSLRSFAEIFYMLLNGNGVGMGLSAKYLSRFPDLVDKNDKTGTVVTYLVHDTIEGWSDAVEALLMCYFRNTPYTGRKIVFDYSKIRPAGAPLKTGGGKAPGYKGLKNALTKIKNLLDHIIEDKKQSRLKTINAYDIVMHLSDAVLSGGIRRSATSVIFDQDDNEMMDAKTFQKVDKIYSFHPHSEKTTNGFTTKLFEGKVMVDGIKYELILSEYDLEQLKKTNTISWWHIYPQRARSNNSVLFQRDKVTQEDVDRIIQKTKEFGEPGFVFGVEDQLFNPCFTIDTKILTEDGWRTFEDLLGKEVNIIQDGRVNRSNDDWEINSKIFGTSTNLATNIRKTGDNKKVYKLTTSCGREVKATDNHEFATPNGMVKLSDLKPKDKILVAIPPLFTPDFNSRDFKLGYLMGLVYGDGNVQDDKCVNIDLWENDESVMRNIEEITGEITKEETKNQRKNKTSPKFLICFENEKHTKYRLSSSALNREFNKYGYSKNNLDWIHKLNKDLKAGFLAGLFYADGHIEASPEFSRYSIRITSNKFKNMQNVCLIFQELGVLARVYDLLPEREALLPDGKGGIKEYTCKRSYRVVIDAISNIQNCKTLLFPFKGEKFEKLEKYLNSRKLKPYKSSFFARVKSIEYHGMENVYCLNGGVRKSLVANGLTASNCFEISFLPVTEDGVCAIQFCNLTSINGVKVKSLDDFLKAVESATIIGTLQASYTHFPYLSNTTKKLTEEEALLGVSITGFMDNPDILLNPEYQRLAAEKAKQVNEEFAKILGINPAARITTCKPEGTSSLVLKSASGIHPHHSRRYFRRVQCNKLDNVYNFFKMYNPDMCEQSVWSENKTDDVITFPIEIPEKAMVKEDLTAIKHLEIIKSTQQNWVIPGTSKYNKKPLHHNVSCTVVVDTNEWEEVSKYLFENRDYFAAVALLPKTGDKSYPQAPLEAVETPEDIAKFEALKAALVKVDYKKLSEGDDETKMTETVACGGGKCEVI